MNYPLYADLEEILNDFLKSKGIERIYSRNDYYINKENCRKIIQPLIKGSTHIASVGDDKKIVPHSLLEMIRLADEINANAFSIEDSASYYLGRGIVLNIYNIQLFRLA